MILFPNAKINLGLKVLEKRSDGFHNIETILYPVELYDILEILPSERDTTSFTTSGIKIPGDTEGNLCMKACRLLTSIFSLPPVCIHLHKVIPIGAGLGGGSSDGAFTIRILNEIFLLGLPDQQMMDLAGQLGSDCAFFIRNEPVYAYGKGDQIKPVEINLSGFKIKIFTPDFPVNTAMAYRMIDDERAQRMDGGSNEEVIGDREFLSDGGSFQKIIGKPVREWRDLLSNDFERPVFSKYPVIAAIKNKFYDEGAVYSSMSGSGSSVYAIFE